MVAERHEAAPVVVAGEVEHDRAEIGGRAVDVGDPVRRPGEPEERLLDEVLGGVAVVDEQAGQPDQRPALLLEEPDDELLGRRS